jgi:7-cyano-7-deazaguanine synthase
MIDQNGAGRLAIAAFSGGLDSTTLVVLLQRRGFTVHALTFDYGQRHRREIDAAIAIARALDVRHSLVDLSSIRSLLAGSALTDDAVDVPEGNYDEDSMRATVVPNRNSIMLSIAFAAAVAERAALVAFGAHAGDHFIYPDCRREFVSALDAAERLGNVGFAAPELRIEAPFAALTKADIVRLGADLRVPFGDTWSCYVGGARHCGRCGTCSERIEAFRLADVSDPTEYQIGARQPLPLR